MICYSEARILKYYVSWNHLVLVRFISNLSLAKYCSECRVTGYGSMIGVKLNARGRANAEDEGSYLRSKLEELVLSNP
jgi:hypothetical protein